MSTLILRPLRALLRLLRRLLFRRVVLGMVIGLGLAYGGWRGNTATSTDAFCASCHVHPHATSSWKKSPHYDNDSGVFVHCVQCHLPPPKGLAYLKEKVRVGVRDAWGTWIGDPENIDWEARSQLEHASTHVSKASCVGCHENIFPLSLTEEGDEAHLHYSQHEDELRCISCHLGVGHESRRESQRKKKAFGLTAGGAPAEVFDAPALPERFEDFRETIPGTSVAFELVAVPGGTFTIGSPPSEDYREDDEGPQREVRLTPFWMGRTEVTWDEYLAFYEATRAEGRSDTRPQDLPEGADAISGATPPYGDPDQGWGKGARPAITMTSHAAETYCRWLSQVTGKTYRLPTEAEWEYACRGGTEGAYFFEGDPGDFSRRGLWNRLFGVRKEGIAEHVIYALNSGGRTQPFTAAQPNPFGLLNMSGSVAELCSDRYAADAYARYPEGEVVVDPRGPDEGDERVIRGGSFRSDAAEVRSAAREPTRHDEWMRTDPQVPKSKWWYSDCVTVGFRVVCEVDLEDAR